VAAAQRESDDKGCSALYPAAESGTAAVVKELLNAEALHAPSINGSTPLHIAAEMDRPDVVALLLLTVASIQSARMTNSSGDTHCTAQLGITTRKVIRVLLSDPAY